MSVTFKRTTNEVTEGANCPQGDYRVRLFNLAYDDGENSLYPKSEPDIKWVLNIRDVEDAEKEDGEDPKDWVGKDLWFFSSQSMGVTREGKPTKGRMAAEAFLGRKLEDEEDLDPGAILQREAIATVGRSRNNRTKVVSLRRLPKAARADKGAPAESAPKPAAVDDDADPWDDKE